MKSFQQFIENIESPSAGVAQTAPVQQPAQQQSAITDDSVVGRQEIQQLLMMLSKKLGTKFNQYKPLINDIQPKNMKLFFGLIEDLSTLKQSVGSKVVTTMQNRMS